jgi:UDP-glucose 4-epimerase
MKKNILVFGAAGFMGTYLINELMKQDYQITASDISQFGEEYYKSKGIPYIHVDITNENDFKRLKSESYDVVIHLAATQPANVSVQNYDPKDYINVNVNGTLNILEFCRKNLVKKIIYASSHRNTQGLWDTIGKPIKEDDGRSIKYSGQYSMFSISESAAQDCVLHYQEEYGLKAIIFRLPPVYGYGPHTEIFFNGKPIKTGFQIFKENAMACKPLEVWGDGTVGRDIIYVKDVISAFEKAITNERAHGLYNITSGRRITLNEEAEAIAKVFWGDDSKPQVIKRPEKQNHIESFVYDISRAKRELDWAPQYSFEDMLYDFVKEEDSKNFIYLIEKRKQLNKETNNGDSNHV